MRKHQERIIQEEVPVKSGLKSVWCEKVMQETAQFCKFCWKVNKMIERPETASVSVNSFWKPEMTGGVKNKGSAGRCCCSNRSAQRSTTGGCSGADSREKNQKKLLAELEQWNVAVFRLQLCFFFIFTLSWTWTFSRRLSPVQERTEWRWRSRLTLTWPPGLEDEEGVKGKQYKQTWHKHLCHET